MSTFCRLGVASCFRLFCAALSLIVTGVADADRPGDLSKEWLEAVRLEEEALTVQREEPQAAVRRYLEASRHFERAADELDGLPMALWRSARCAWLAGYAMADDDMEGRLNNFKRAEELATRGLERDPECAECMLWKFSAMGRRRTSVGVWKGIRQVAEMAALLDRAIALKPTHADSDWNSTLGNLYYASASFYRVVPEWFWLKWFLGARGDRARARVDIRAALALHPMRVDYQVELGSQLLCEGTTGAEKEAPLQAGREILERALLAEPQRRDDTRDLEAARIMLQEPARACGYTGDVWVEVSEADVRDAEF